MPKPGCALEFPRNFFKITFSKNCDVESENVYICIEQDSFNVKNKKKKAKFKPKIKIENATQTDKQKKGGRFINLHN